MDSPRDPLIEYRIRVIRIGLVLSALGLLTLGIWFFRIPATVGAPLRLLLLADLGAVILLSAAPWRRALSTGIGELLVAMWSVLVVITLVGLETTRASTPTSIGYLVVVVFAAATLGSASLLGLVAAASLAGFSYALYDAGLSPGHVAVLATAFLAAALLILLLSEGTKAQLERNRAQVVELGNRERQLQEKERELASLYHVSATIGAGSNLAEVLPELVGRVVEALEAKTGLILLYRPDGERLEVMSPIWVSGHTVEAEGYSVPLTDEGLVPRVFISGDAGLDNGAGSGPADRLLVDLAANRIAAVPLRVEQRRIGVLLVADKRDANFTPTDLATLESLAAPAALVLNQLARYEEARATGMKMTELARLKTDFVSVVSHELRTPLTSIIGSLRTLQRPELAPEDPNATELIATAVKQANRLRKLIEDLLVVSRLDAEALPVQVESLSAAGYLAEVVTALPTVEGRVVLDVDPELTRIDADPDHLARIVTNLVENAVKYSGGGAIVVRAFNHEDDVRIAVIDHGSGISYERKDHVFDRFTQLQPHETRSRGGAGLGLFIVRGLTEAMNGRVWFEPTVGGGATFVVALPRSPVRVG